MSNRRTVSILHFRKELRVPPVAHSAAGIGLRNISLPDDVPAWLALRDQAMAGERPAVRSWTLADFQRESVDKPWWRPERSWVALAGDTPDGQPAMIGAVVLGLRKGANEIMPVVHWLLVDPAFRRRGVGRLLMSHLERAACDDGWRELQLETHAGWTAAVAFYQSMGYAPVRDRSLC